MLKTYQFLHTIIYDEKKVKLKIIDPAARRDRKQEEKGTTENEMVGWHH